MSRGWNAIGCCIWISIRPWWASRPSRSGCTGLTQPRWRRRLHPIADAELFAGAPLPDTYGARDLPVITVPPISHNGGPTTRVQTGLINCRGPATQFTKCHPGTPVVSSRMTSPPRPTPTKLQSKSGRPGLGSSRPTLRTPVSAGQPSQSSTGRDREIFGGGALDGEKGCGRGGCRGGSAGGGVKKVLGEVGSDGGEGPAGGSMVRP